MTLEAFNTHGLAELEAIAEHDTRPDWSIFEPPRRNISEIPEEESVLSACIDYSLRPDGSRQIGVLYGTVQHSFEPSSTVYTRMLQDWPMIPQWYKNEGVGIGERVVLITEGCTRNPPVDRTKDPAIDAPTIIEKFSELGLQEYLARHAGVEVIVSPEPEDGDAGQDFFLRLGYKHGFKPLISYLGERLIWQAAGMSENSRGSSVDEYVDKRMWDRHAKLMTVISELGYAVGVTGFKRYFNETHPEYAQASLNDLALDSAFVMLTHDETRHIQILRKPSAGLNSVEHLTLKINWERDRRFVQAYLDGIAQGKDVFVNASAVHLIPILQAVERLGNFNSIDHFGPPFGGKL